MCDKVEVLYKFDDEKIYYVYLHKKKTNGEVFYVGKGKNKRAWATKDRNPHWKKVKNKHGLVVEIYKDNLSEKEALDREIEVIKHYGIENLTNYTLGGISTTGYKHTEETKKLQSEIMKNRLENQPEVLDRIKNQLSELHNKQVNDLCYKKQFSDKIKKYHNNLSEEEKKEYSEKRTNWQKDKIKHKRALEKRVIKQNTPEYKKNMSDKQKEIWNNLNEFDKSLRVEVKTKILLEKAVIRAKEINSQPIVLNRCFYFKSKKQLANFLKISNIKRENLSDDNLRIFKKDVIENYNEIIHGSDFLDHSRYEPLIDYNKSQPLRKDDKIYLSITSAVKTVMNQTKGSFDNARDWISAVAKGEKGVDNTTYGHKWSFPTEEEVQLEIYSLLSEYKTRLMGV